MTQIEQKLKKLPEKFRKRINGVRDTYKLSITKENGLWLFKYYSIENEYTIVEVLHDNLQAAVDTMLAELKKIRVNI